MQIVSHALKEQSVARKYLRSVSVGDLLLTVAAPRSLTQHVQLPTQPAEVLKPPLNKPYVLQKPQSTLHSKVSKLLKAL